MQLKHWFSQWRRLINLDRALRSNSSSPHLAQHIWSLWRAVRAAPGFSGGFAAWWTTRTIVHPNAPSFIPVRIPTSSDVSLILINFAAEVKALDQQLHNAWISRTKAKHANNPNAVFQAVRDPGPVPVEVLLDQQSCTVTEVVDEGSVTVDQSEALDASLPLLCNGVPLKAEIISENQIWFQSIHDLQPGMTIVQQRPIGNLHSMFETFATEWSNRWDKHQSVPEDRWNSINDFIDSHVPQGCMQCQPITLPQWDLIVRSKPSRSAVGMDGVHRDDLLHMPKHLKLQLLDLIDQTEQTGHWPEQLVHGGVFSLEKRPGASQVHEFRPITVLPTVYRIWSTIRSRELIAYLCNFVPSHLYGNVKGRSSVNMWWSAQAMAEQCMYDEQVAVGVIADLQKAFNTLPRSPLFRLGIRLGVSNRILRPWLHMLSRLERHFFIRNACGPGVKSCTGFAEGCGLSVAAMMMCNILVHLKMTLLHPSVHMWSYVDNWELFGHDVQEVIQAFEALDQICQELDLSIDRNKTVTWALDGASRQHLRSEGLVVQRNLRDLGGHQQFSRQQTNGTLKAQCERLTKLWPALARSVAPYHQKLKVIRCKAWPRGLHAASGVHIAPGIFNSLRAGAGKSLRSDKAGSNSQILLSLVHFPAHDPACFAIIDAIIQFRRFAEPVAVEPYLWQASTRPDSLRVPGPCGVLLSRVELLGWTLIKGTLFQDQDSLPIDVLHSPLKEVLNRVHRSWQLHVGSLWISRHGFDGLQQVDAATTAAHLIKLDNDQQGPIRALLSGVFITADQQGDMFRIDQSERVCKFCQAPDSLFHRHWQCEHTKPSRDQIPPEVLTLILNQPACFRERGWCIELPILQVFRRELLQIPDQTHLFNLPPTLPEEFDCFTDGAARDPNCPSTRIATWGFVLGDIANDYFWPTSEGGVPGLWQTVARAEIYAVLSVVKFVKKFPRCTRIWCDNQLVVDRLQQLLEGKLRCTSLLHDHDLWTQIDNTLRGISHHVSVHKVFSHQDQHTLTEAESWIVSGNIAADRIAGQAFDSLPTPTQQVWQQASGEIAALHTAHRHMFSHMARVAYLSIQFGKVHLVDAAPEPYQPPEQIFVGTLVRDASTKLTRSLHFDGREQVFSWLLSIEEADAPIKQVSFPELLIAFQLATGLVGVESVHTTKHNHRQWRLRDTLVEYSFNEVNRSFSAFCCSIFKISDHEWKATQGRPSSFRFQYWTTILAIAISPGILQQVESWLMTHCGTMSFRRASDMASLPLACGPPL